MLFFLYIMRYNYLKIGTDDVGSNQWRRRLHDWADVIRAGFQTVIYRCQQNISTYLFCTSEIMLRTMIMQNSTLVRHVFHSKSSRLESAPVMTDDVGRSPRHQCPQCDKRHSIGHRWGQGMACLLRVQLLMKFCQSRCSAVYNMILDWTTA